MKVVAGIDLGGTGIRCVIYRDRQCIARARVATAEIGQGSRAARVSRLAETLLGLMPSDAKLAGVGIGASGPVDRDAGVVQNPATLPWFSTFSLTAALSDRLGVPVIMENDAVTAAIAEQCAGAGRLSPRMLMVTLGTGIGVALLVDGMPFRGPNGAHPEAGHVPIITSAVRCYCGTLGCWEQLASRSALQTTLRCLLSSEVADRDLLESAAQQAHEPAIAEALRAYGRLVGRGLSVHHALYMPDTTVIAGSVAPYLQLIRPGIEEVLTHVNSLAPAIGLHAAVLGDEAGAIGAAMVAEHLLA